MTRSNKNRPSSKVLRIGVIRMGKIVEERLVRSGEPVTVGQSTSNTFVLATDTIPNQHKLFVHKGGRYHLVFTDHMDGKISVNNAVRPLAELRSELATRRGGRSWLPLNETNRGKVQMGDSVLLFQFVDAPPEPRKVPVSFSPFSFQQLDWIYAGFFLFSCVINAAAYIYIDSQPLPGKVTIDDIPERFATVMLPAPVEEQPETKEDGPEVGKDTAPDPTETTPTEPTEDKEDAVADNEEPVNVEELRRQRKAAMMETGLIPLFGTNGATSSDQNVADLIGEGNLQTDLDAALGESQTLKVAVYGDSTTLRRGGVGDGKVAGIFDVDTSGGHDAGEGHKEQLNVSISLTEKPDVIGGDATDIAAIRKRVRAKKGQVQACYEEQLRQFPDIGGRIEMTWTILPDGSVTAVYVSTNNTGSEALGQCISRRITRWSFAKGDAEFDVTFPFILESS